MGAMKLDDHVCHCYHVPLRKILHFLRRRRPTRASQLSECLGAGTGCGWCIPILKRIWEQAADAAPSIDLGMTSEEYARRRKEYIDSGQPKNTF